MKNVEVKFPLIEDIKMEVANKFGMIQPGQSNTQAVRAVFVIDPDATIRTILYYPLSMGRNFDELKRIILALQKADKDNVSGSEFRYSSDDDVNVEVFFIDLRNSYSSIANLIAKVCENQLKM